MKLYVRVNKMRLCFPISLRMLLLLPADKVCAGLRLNGKEDIRALYRALRQARRDFRGLELVHVRTAGGDEIIVRL